MAYTFHKKLLPFRQYNENDVVNQFSLWNTGEMGQFVAVASANFDTAHGWNYTNPPGASQSHASSFRYEVKNRIRPVVSGDTRYKVLGLQLSNVLESDENSQKLLYNPQKCVEESAVLSGQAVPVATRGVFTLSSLGYKGYNAAVPTGSNLARVGYVLVPSDGGAGFVDVVDPATYVGYTTQTSGRVLTRHYSSAQVIGKVLGTGSKFSKYIVFQLMI